MQAEHAEKLKADGMMTLPELYYKPRTAEQLVGYLQSVSEAAPNLPLIYYHFPMMTGVDGNLGSLSSCLPNLFLGSKGPYGKTEPLKDLSCLSFWLSQYAHIWVAYV